jgi:hypothetical protein
VILVASGETERTALPHLLLHLESAGVSLGDVRTPPHHRNLDGPMAARLVIAAYWSVYPRPEKFVVLVDADADEPSAVAGGVRHDLLPRVADLGVPVLVVAAKWHLEAWFFADAPGLREYLKRDLGAVDPSQPDAIINPKNHLKNLLGRTYTARIAAEIAEGLSATAITQSSPSYRGLERAMMNGHAG